MMDWIEVNDTSLRYEVSGAGANILVLVHEMGGTLESWDEVLPLVMAGRRVLRYDLRGAGLSEKIKGSVSFDTMVEDLAALLEAVGIDGKVSLAGCAVGAGIALEFALRFPARVAALVAMAPATGIAPERRAATLARAESLVETGPRAVVEENMAMAYPPEVRGDSERYRTFRARWIANDPESFAAIYRMLVAADMEGRLGEIACPTLVIAGTHDKLRPPALVRQVAAHIPGAAFQELDTGHFMAVQTPGAVAEAIAAFLAGVG
jgi:3-oxoadipate enol-lactonase